MSTDLLPCPFCGTSERDDEQELDLEKWLQVTPASGMFRVECFGCGVEGRMFDTPEEAVLTWNRRKSPDTDTAPLDSLDRGVDLLRQLLGPWFEKGRRITLSAHRDMISLESKPGDAGRRFGKGDLTVTFRGKMP